eukprot:gene25394-30663_t
MAAMKSMIQILLDVSPSMQADNKLENAKAFIGHYITQRMIASKTVEFGLMTYGDDETHNYLNSTQGGYEHVNEIIGMGKPDEHTLCAVPKVHAGRRAGDLLDGLIAAQDVLIRVNAGKAYNRILILITDGESRVEGLEDIDAVVKSMTEMDKFSLYIAMVTNPSNLATPSTIQSENSKMLSSLLENLQGRFRIVKSPKDFVSLLSVGHGLGTKPTLSRCTLQLSADCKLRVAYYGKISKAAFPTLKKRKRDAGNGDDEDTSLQREITYHTLDDADTHVPSEERVKGYKYGSQYVPWSSADEEMCTINGEAGLVVLGAMPRAEVPRHHYMEAPIVLHADPNADAGTYTCMQSLSTALRGEDLVLLARVTKRANSDPYVAVLVPHTEGGEVYDCFIGYRLPCADDLREYGFPSLINFEVVKATDTAKQQQLKSVDALLDAYLLPANSVEGDGSVVTPVCTALHRVYATMYDKILGVHNVPSPISAASAFAEGDMVAYTAEQQARISEAVKQVYSLFPLKKMEVQSKREGKRVFWSDIQLDGGAAATNNAAASNGAAAAVQLDMSKVSSLLRGEPIASSHDNNDNSGDAANTGVVSDVAELPELLVGSVTPLEDFLSRLAGIAELARSPNSSNMNITALLQSTLEVMVKIIDRNVLVGASRAHYKRGVSCLQVLRQACIQYDLAGVFNTYMQSNVRQYKVGRHSAFYYLLQEEQVYLINCEESQSSSISVVEAKEYYTQQAKVEVKEEKKVEEAPEDEDLFGELE